MSETGDRSLVQAVLDGNQHAYRLLVQRHEDVLYRRALAIVGDPDTAADAVQDAFVRAYERLARCADPDRFGGWVYRMLRNRCLDELRAARRRGQSLAAAATLTSDDDPEDDFHRTTLRGVIRTALDALTPPLREAFVLKHVDGLSYDEMQASTGVARSALKMRVKRAREELERRLRPQIEAADDVTPDGPRTSNRLETARPSRRGNP
jgi:RNA polymerase sigma-70 factor (ECF subfamily)